MSTYDNEEEKRDQDLDDAETIDQLEWELASQAGHVTGQCHSLDPD